MIHHSAMYVHAYLSDLYTFLQPVSLNRKYDLYKIFIQWLTKYFMWISRNRLDYFPANLPSDVPLTMKTVSR